MHARRLELELQLKQVARRVAAYCKQQGWTWADGKAMKPSVQKVSAWEHAAARPCRRYHHAYANALQWTPQELAERWPDPPPDPPASAAPGAEPRPSDSPAIPTDLENAANGTIRSTIGYPHEVWSDPTLREDALVAVAGQTLADEREMEVTGQVKRRVLLTSTGAAAVGVALDPLLVLVQTGRERIARTDVSDEWLADRQQTIRHYARIFPTTRPDSAGYAKDFARTVFGDWASMNSLLGAPMRAAQRRELHRVHAQLCGILGLVLFELGQDQRAAALFEVGREGAREAGDTDLLGWLFAKETLIPLWSGDPSGALELAEQGLAVAGGGLTRTAAALYSQAMAARARLVDRDRSNAYLVERELQAADDILAKASGGAWDDDHMASPFAFRAATLSYKAGRAYLDMGDAKRGMEICLQALTLERGAAVKDYANITLGQLNLAQGTVALGDPVAAAEQAAGAMATYEGHNHNVLRRAAEVRTALEPHRALHAVADYSALLRERTGTAHTLPSST